MHYHLRWTMHFAKWAAVGIATVEFTFRATPLKGSAGAPGRLLKR
jgi:hypothetical protein